MEDEEILNMLVTKTEQKSERKKAQRTPAKRASENNYKKKNQKTIAVNFFPPTMHLYDYLKSASEKASITPAKYIRDLIRQDMERNRQQNP